MSVKLNDAKNGEVTNTFQLIGRNEDALTRGIAWVLRSCPALLAALIFRTTGSAAEGPFVLTLHAHRRGLGITDLEIQAPALHIILEAKLGWILPSANQLSLYRQRFKDVDGQRRLLLTMSEVGSHAAQAKLPRHLDGVEVRHLSWTELGSLARAVVPNVSHAEKRLLRELADHLEDSMTRRRENGLVYVVALSDNPVEVGSTLTWRDVVTKHRRYFHPVGSTYPDTPVGNIAFRYDGRLQSIHHVDAFEVIDDLAQACEGIPSMPVAPHFLYRLGPPILPPNELRAGPRVLRSARVWVAFDTLFTSPTLSDALTETQRRQASGA